MNAIIFFSYLKAPVEIRRIPGSLIKTSNLHYTSDQFSAENLLVVINFCHYFVLLATIK